MAAIASIKDNNENTNAKNETDGAASGLPRKSARTEPKDAEEDNDSESSKSKSESRSRSSQRGGSQKRGARRSKPTEVR